jgi:hypothetical protein
MPENSGKSIFISRIVTRAGYSRRGFFYKAFLSVANSNGDFIRRVKEVVGAGYMSR